MAAAVTLTYRIALVVCGQTTDQPTLSVLSTPICASMTRPPCRTETSRIEPQWATRETSCRTHRIDSMTSSAATLPSSRTIRTCWTSVCQSRRLHSRRTMAKCSVTRLRKCRSCTRPEFTGRARRASDSSWTLRMAMHTTQWSPISSPTTACRNLAATLTCRSE